MVEPLDAEPQTDFAWQLIRNDVTRRFNVRPCEPQMVGVAAPSWSERRAEKKELRLAEQATKWPNCCNDTDHCDHP